MNKTENISIQTLDQIIYDANCYKANLIAIENAKEKLPNYIGKPFYDGILESIDNWEKSNIEIKKTFIPFMEKATLELKNK